MARPDLEEGYGGWQAVDATPQETSNGNCHFQQTLYLTAIRPQLTSYEGCVSLFYKHFTFDGIQAFKKIVLIE